MHNQTIPGRTEYAPLRHKNFVNRNSQRQVHYYTPAWFVQVLPPQGAGPKHWTARRSAAAPFQQQNNKTNSLKSVIRALNFGAWR